jgi:CDP-diacylglycerol--glycerol-3-phosphate 3-phosphatidyltransferase
MANLITISRFPVLVAVILLLFSSDPLACAAGTGLTVLLILMDTLDGVVARARKEESLLGSVLDIMADRTVELVMWVVFAHLALVPVAIPIIYIVRGTVVDSLRSIHVSAGSAPFKGMRTRLGAWLVGSPAMRSSYGISKLISFTGLALAHTMARYAAQGAADAALAETLGTVFLATSWVSVAFCLVRGLPVVVEALPILAKADRPSA